MYIANVQMGRVRARSFIFRQDPSSLFRNRALWQPNVYDRATRIGWITGFILEDIGKFPPDRKTARMTQSRDPIRPDGTAITPNAHIDSDHAQIQAFAAEIAKNKNPKQAAIALYYAVRDGWRYTPWHVSFAPEDYKASVVLARDPAYGHCIDKAVLLAALCRARGIPALLHFANVRNHVATARLEEKLGTDLLVYHGYTELYLDGRWVAATPAFNRELCEHLGVSPLEFDGEHDSIFQPYDREAGKFMEYVTDHGVHADLPFHSMLAAWKLHYPPVQNNIWPRPNDEES